jgi:hypothetical protein
MWAYFLLAGVRFWQFDLSLFFGGLNEIRFLATGSFCGANEVTESSNMQENLMKLTLDMLKSFQFDFEQENLKMFERSR